MKHEYREVRKIRKDDLRNLCIANRWYTRGDNAAYNHLLNDLAGDKENITTDDIVEIARDILEHSDTNEELTSICFEVARIAVTFFEEAQEIAYMVYEDYQDERILPEEAEYFKKIEEALKRFDELKAEFQDSDDWELGNEFNEGDITDFGNDILFINKNTGLEAYLAIHSFVLK